MGHRLYRVSWSHVVHENHEVVACGTCTRNEQSRALKPGDGTADELRCR